VAYYKSPNPPFSVALPLQMTFLMSNVALPSGEIFKFVRPCSIQFLMSKHFSPYNPAITSIFRPCSCPPLRLKEGDLAAVAQRLMLVQRLERAAEDDVGIFLQFSDVDWCWLMFNLESAMATCYHFWDGMGIRAFFEGYVSYGWDRRRIWVNHTSLWCQWKWWWYMVIRAISKWS